MTVVDLARTSACLVRLEGTPVFTLTGDDVRRWTNGMFTNNTRRLKPGDGNRHCACDDRGRVLGVLDLYMLAADRVAIVLEGMTLDAFVARYRMYLLLDEIELDADDAPVLLSVQGPSAQSVVTAAGLSWPERDHGHIEMGGDPFTSPTGLRICRKDRTGSGGVDLLVGVESVEAVEAQLRVAGAVVCSIEELDGRRVVGGRAAWPADGTGKSMVHELRLDAECCAFDKGCYVGQEVLNRIDVKGAINKRLTGVQLDSAVGSGASVELNGRTVGQLTSRATLATGEELGLGVLRKTVWAIGTSVTVVDGDRQVAGTVVALPFGTA